MKNEQEIKDLYKQLQQADAEQIPGFEETWTAAQRMHGKKISMRKWTRIAATFLILFGLAYAWYALDGTFSDHSREIASTEALSNWESPTAFLLESQIDGVGGAVDEIEFGMNSSIGAWQSPTDGMLMRNKN